MTKEIREDMKGLCLGETGTGGSTGMAVLEGYAAVIEVRLNVWGYLDLAVEWFAKRGCILQSQNHNISCTTRRDKLCCLG